MRRTQYYPVIQTDAAAGTAAFYQQHFDIITPTPPAPDFAAAYSVEPPRP